MHLAGGAGIGGVLEPLQASATIVEDDCFIGQSTRIYDRVPGAIHYGRVPAGAVLVPGSLPAADGSHSLACAVIVKRVDARTRAKVGLNELLRDLWRGNRTGFRCEGASPYARATPRVCGRCP